MRCLNGITISMDMHLGKPRELVMDREVGVLGSRGSTESDPTDCQLDSAVAI